MRPEPVDLNADLGEGAPNDSALLALVDRCSIACGGHAGDARTMRRTLEAAAAAGVLCGAHPSYPDREHFGRRTITMPHDRLADALAFQIATLAERAALTGVALVHVKAHGALYNDAAADNGLAGVVAQVAARLLPGVALIGPPASALERAAARFALPFLAEGFPERAYLADGRLAPRDRPGAVIGDAAIAADRGLKLALGEPLDTLDGGSLTLRIQTLCVHGDAPNAVAIAAALKAALHPS